MKKRSLFSFSISLLICSASAFPTSAQSSPCTGSSNVEINQCLQRRYREADQQLNRVYQQVRATLNPQEKRVLTDAQLVWIQFRDKSCNFETYRSRGGSGYSGFLNGCLERVTRSRTAELENWLQGR